MNLLPRQCPFPGCERRVPSWVFACRKHWYSLAKPLRDEIWAAWSDYQTDRITIEELRRRQEAVLAEVAK